MGSALFVMNSVKKWFLVIREKVCTFALSNSINSKRYDK